MLLSPSGQVTTKTILLFFITQLWGLDFKNHVSAKTLENVQALDPLEAQTYTLTPWICILPKAVKP